MSPESEVVNFKRLFELSLRTGRVLAAEKVQVFQEPSCSVNV
jgi:hypothetical protein